jgi:hypothetical protein
MLASFGFAIIVSVIRGIAIFVGASSAGIAVGQRGR